MKKRGQKRQMPTKKLDNNWFQLPIGVGECMVGRILNQNSFLVPFMVIGQGLGNNFCQSMRYERIVCLQIKYNMEYINRIYQYISNYTYRIMKLEHLLDNQKPTNDDNQQITIGGRLEADCTALREKAFPMIITE